MRPDPFSSCSTSSTIGELPGSLETLPVDARGKELADLLHDRPELPGVLLAAGGEVVSAVSRRYYLDMIGRYCGMDLYLPRPIRLMMERFDSLGGALVLPASIGIQAAVETGLQRSRELIYEPLVVRAERAAAGSSRAKLVDFEQLLIASSRLTLLRNAQMGQILGTVREGLLLVDRELRVLPEYSSSVEAILGTPRVAGRELGELLADVLDPERCTLARAYLEILWDPDVIEGLIADINPLVQVETLPRAGETRILAFRFARAVEGGAIRHVLVRIEDVTRAERLAREVEIQRERSERRLSLALGAVQIEPEILPALLDRLATVAGDLAAADAPWRAEPPDGAGLAELFRRVHSLKGEAALARFEPARATLHAVEDELAKLREGAGAAPARFALERRADEVGELVAETRGVLEHFARLGTRRGTQAPGGPREAPERSLLSALAGLVADLSTELGKSARFVSRLHEEDLPETWRGALREVLVQLVRNALAHGVEPPAERRRTGKPESATLQLGLREHAESGWVELVFQDDGRGIDWPAVARRAATLGLAARRPEELADALFHPGFSTVERATLHAGRGVGLDLARRRVEELGGALAVHSEPGAFCAFQILLPLPVAAVTP